MTKKNGLNQTTTATLMFSLANLIHYGCGLLYTPIFSRVMTQQEYGTVTIYSSWAGILTTALTLNIWSSAYIGFVEFKGEEDQYAANAIKVAMPMCIVAAVLLAVFPNILSEWFVLSPALLWFLLLNVFVTPAFQLWSFRQRYDYRYKALFWISIANSIAVLICGLVAIFLFPGHKSEARIIGGGWVQLTIYTVLFFLLLVRGGRKGNRMHQKFALKMSLAQMPNSLANSLLSQMDRIMIAQTIGESATAVYGMAGTISSAFYSVVMVAINASWVPYIYRSLSENKPERLNKTSVRLTMLVALGCFMVVLIAPEALLILGGESYEAAKWCVPGLVLSLLVSFAAGGINEVMVFCKKPQYICLGTIIAAGINIGLNALLIPRWGAVVAGYTTLLSSMVMGVVDYKMMRTISANTSFNCAVFDVKRLVMICIGTTIAALLCVGLLYDRVAPRYAIVFIICLVAVLNMKKIWRILKSEQEA